MNNMQKKQIAVIGVMGLNDPIIVKLKERYPEIVIVDSIKEVRVNKLQLPEPMPIINRAEFVYQDYKDGKSLRRERRKAKRK
jgi:hypothetical protein